MSNWETAKKNWKWLILLWFNGTLTIISVIFTVLTNWLGGVVFYLSAIIFVGLLLQWKETPGYDHSDTLIRLTDEAIYEGADGSCCCKYCGSENQFLPEFSFDPRLHYPTCIVVRARQSVDPAALKLAPDEAFNYQGARREQEEEV